MRTKLAISIGAVVLVLVIVFCVLPLKQVAYGATEDYQTSETYYTSEPYTERIPYVVNEPHSVQVRYTEEEPYTVWQNIIEEGTGKVIGREAITKYRTVVKYRSEVVYGPVTKYREVTLYRDAAGQTQVWQERPAPQYKKVSFLEALIAY
jgi:predicted RNA-binding protein YlqC (UPF0109 family)